MFLLGRGQFLSFSPWDLCSSSLHAFVTSLAGQVRHRRGERPVVELIDVVRVLLPVADRTIEHVPPELGRMVQGDRWIGEPSSPINNPK